MKNTNYLCTVIKTNPKPLNKMENIGNKHKKLTTQEKLNKVYKHLTAIHDVLSWEDDVSEFIRPTCIKYQDSIEKSIEKPTYETGIEAGDIAHEEYKKTLAIIKRVLTKRLSMSYPSYY